jgi:hypothetical protein
MSTCRAYSIIGFEIKSEDFFTPIKVKTFEHEYPESMNFCPVTGKRLWRTIYQTPALYNEYEATYNGFKTYEDDEDKILYIGIIDQDKVDYTLEEVIRKFAEVKTAFPEEVVKIYTLLRY